MIVFYILIALVILMLMIVIHEFGHYLVGHWLGFKITEFSVGFGPKILQKTNKRGEKISLRLIPLGGYCAFYGEEDETDENGNLIASKDDPNFFTNQKPWKRLIVYFAGAFANFLSTFIFAFILLLATGYGNAYQVGHVNEHFIATAGPQNQIVEIHDNDKIIAIDGVKIDYVWGNTSEKLITNVEGNVYTLTIKKADTNEVVDVKIQVQTGQEQVYDKELGQYVDSFDDEGNPVYYTGLGLMMGLANMPLGFWDALAGCFSLTIGFAWMVIKTLFLLFTFQAPLSSLGATFTVISTLATNMSISLSVVLVYLPLIAVNLAIFNILPFPALDGGHSVFTTLEWAHGKPVVKRETENKIHFIGLIIVFAFAIFLDLNHFLL